MSSAPSIDVSQALVRVSPGAGVPPRELIGGKAFNLALLAQHGVAVPRGFCLTTAVYEASLRACGLLDDERELRTHLPDEGARGALGALLASCELPAEIRAALASELLDLFDEPPEVSLAVRSSTVAEDGGARSFAGAHDSVLGVSCDVAAVEEAMQACWRSLWSRRAVAYRQQFALEASSVAVLVQELLDPEIAAVAFTKEPVNDLDERILVSVTCGLGDALTAGRDEGTMITLDRTTREVLVCDGADADAHERSIPAVRELATLALLVERLLGAPADVEAVHTARGGWIVVQARPVTS